MAIVFQDGFADLNNWTLDGLAGNVAPGYSTAQNHGSIAGAGSIYFQAGSPHWLYHDFASSLTAGGYKTGTLSGWIYDGAVSGLRIALRAYLYDSTGANKTMYWIGVTNGNPPNISTHYIGAVLNGTWTYYDLGSRTAGWHKLAIDVLPYTGSNDLKFYVDGNLAYTASQPAVAASAFIRRAYLGYNYNVNQDTYFDDITLESLRPAAPSNVTATGLSASSIRWSFSDNANNEIGNRIYNGSTKTAEREVMDATYVDEAGLLPNTIYTRTVRAYAGALESAGAIGTGNTLSAPPTATSVTCNRATGAWQKVSPFYFTAVGGFGSGTVNHYLVAWDQLATHTWTGTEAVWSNGTSVQNATSSASGWYFHVKGFNSHGLANGTLDLGPYYCDSALPVIGAVALTPPMAAVGDAIHAVVDATDNVDVTSVTANGVSLAKSAGSTWAGDILAIDPIGVQGVTIVATDSAQNSATDATATYRSARIVGASTRAAWQPMVSSACGIYLFKFWGKVAEIDGDYFTLSDGSGPAVMVRAPGYKTKVVTGDYASARGILCVGGSVESAVGYVAKY